MRVNALCEVGLCERCVWIFFKKQPTQRFCTDKCATADRVRRLRERRARERAAMNAALSVIDGGSPHIAELDVCDGCGIEFLSISASQTGGDPRREPRRYHSIECRELHKKQRQVMGS